VPDDLQAEVDHFYSAVANRWAAARACRPAIGHEARTFIGATRQVGLVDAVGRSNWCSPTSPAVSAAVAEQGQGKASCRRRTAIRHARTGSREEGELARARSRRWSTIRHVDRPPPLGGLRLLADSNEITADAL